MNSESSDGLRRLGAVWERAALEDPYFAVLSDPQKRGGRWDTAAFFASGEREIGTVFEYLEKHGIDMPLDGVALDFGCGLGRLTRPLSRRFERAVGVDVSRTMLDKARALPGGDEGVEFVLNERADLGMFEDATFAFAYSNIVLQHLPPALAKAYVTELLRVTRPLGVVVFQIPDALRLGVVGRIRQFVRLRTRLAALRGDANVESAVAWEMHGTSEARVRRWVTSAGQAVQDVAISNATDPAFNGELRYLDNPCVGGWVSKQYCVVKDGSTRS